jgi:hypothetical protein
MNIYQKEFNMDPKVKAAEIIISYLAIVGQDPYTGLQKAIECSSKSVDHTIDTITHWCPAHILNSWMNVKKEIENYGKDK